LPLLQKAGLVDHEDRFVIRQMLDHVIPHDIAQAISIPIPATQDRLLPPRARIASCLRAHPTGFALLISEQTFQKQACIRRNTILIGAASFATVMMVAFMGAFSANHRTTFDCIYFITTQSTLVNKSIARERGPPGPKFVGPIACSYGPRAKFFL
jgi:hypothetical protein